MGTATIIEVGVLAAPGATGGKHLVGHTQELRVNKEGIDGDRDYEAEGSCAHISTALNRFYLLPVSLALSNSCRLRCNQVSRSIPT